MRYCLNYSGTNKQNFHTIIDWLLVQVTIRPAEESECVLVIWWHSNLIEDVLDVS